MKLIHLIRHSKSDWESAFSRDEERPLSNRGRKNAKMLRNYLSKISFSVDAAIVSPSERTKETFRILSKLDSFCKDVRFSEEIYEADGSDLLGILRSLGSNTESILLIGHNPGLESLAEALVFKSQARTSSLFVKFPTSAFLSLVLESNDWQDCGNIPCQIQRFWIP
ncbi:putative phosphohistidine phosphatase SixA [Leptospira fainei serovar Hurstbridge str. BUT 6]|uniref:Phosphohistidine phosphatase SixA n=1 Tax=Leptospira fainei serovar Hurstbridge str. BUT 6 TaxID=1193011 RepID=S3VXR9_9LEPT|nr:histidine phosphatase family protein [Leptospira fainei]EPG72922.1 putative phosphohistidine phosphatase SixA [Leptospira fainei serovar Hurstbridge str. BUT 6]